MTRAHASSVLVRSVLVMMASALAACSTDSEADDVAMQGARLTSCGESPTTIMATAMTTKTGGGVSGDSWGFYQNGSISQAVNFPQTGVVDFTIEARGTPLGGIWPNMQVRIDSAVVGDVAVNSNTLKTFRASGPVTAGMHQLTIAFTNDAYAAPEDRNLWVRSVTFAYQGSTTQPPPTDAGTTQPPVIDSGSTQPPPTGNFDLKALLAKYGAGPALPHEGFPYGVPTNWSWYAESTGGRNLMAPSGMDYANWWSVIAVDPTQIRPANTRVEFRNARLLVLPLGSNTWTVHFKGGGIGGAGIKGDFTGGCPGGYSATSLGTNAVSLYTVPGCIDHIWSLNPAFIQMPGAGVRAAISIADVRLIKANPNGPDDRANSHFLVQMGADWRRPDGQCATGSHGSLICPGITAGRFIYPKTYWRASLISTMTPAELATLPLPPVDMFRLPDGTLPTE